MNPLRPLAALLVLALGGVGAVATESGTGENPPAVGAKETPPLAARPLRDEVRATVGAQLAAFRESEFEQAYALAAAGIRRQFRLPVWVEMIRRGYAPLLRHQRVEFGLVRPDGDDRASVAVTVFDGENRVTRYRYDLVRERAGWRVAGVVAEREKSGGEF